MTYDQEILLKKDLEVTPFRDNYERHAYILGFKQGARNGGLNGNPFKKNISTGCFVNFCFGWSSAIGYGNMWPKI